MKLATRLENIIHAEATRRSAVAIRKALAVSGRNRVLQIVLQELDRELRDEKRS